jgi:group I intron endonuclease
MPGKIYLVSLNGVPKYVGFTTQTIEKRWKKHIWDSKKIRCPALHSAINKYGPEAFTITEIYSSEDVNHTLNVMEPHFIREHNTHVDCGGYNISYGGDSSTLGRKHSPETRKKIGKAHLGKPLSEEHKQKVSKSLLGRTFSEETKQKMRVAARKTWSKRRSIHSELSESDLIS